MSDYNQTVGIKLQDDFSDVTAELGKLKQKLSELSGAIDVIAEKATNMIAQIKALNKHVETISTAKLSNRNLNSYYKNLEKIVGKAEELAKKNISSISLINTQSNTVNGTAIDPYGVSHKNITKHIQNVNKVKDAIKTAGNEADKTRKKFESLFSIGKIYFLVNYLKQMFRTVGNWINTAIDYYEIENLFQNAMGNMYNVAKAYQSKLTDMYGMSTNTMMQAQATYKNMIGNLGGLSEEMSYRLSEIVTNMTLDFSSLYNVDVDKAIAKFQSALSKQVRPIRSTSGMDITQNVLQLTANRLGIDKTITQMNEVEKRMLIILTLAEQMKSAYAFEDFARTIESPANELRILKEQMIELGKWIGNTLLVAFANLIPYITAVVMLLKEAFMWLSALIGFEYSGSTGTIMDDITGAEDSADNIANSFGSAASSAKDIKKSLAGFDQLNIISKPNESSGSGGGVGTGTIDPAILKALQELDYGLKNVETRASAIKKQFESWVLNIKETTLEKFQGLFEYMTTNKDSILAVITALAGLGTAFAIYPYAKAASAIGLIPTISFAFSNEKLTSFLKTLQEIGTKASPYLSAIAHPITTIKILISSLPSLIGNIPSAFTSLLGAVTSPIGMIVGLIGTIVAAVTYCLATNEDFRNRFIEAFKKILSSTGSIIGSMVEIFMGLWNNVLFPIVSWFIETFGPHIGTVLNFVGEAVLWLLETFAGLLEFISTVFQTDWSNVWSTLGQHISDVFFGMVQAIGLALQDLGKFFSEVFEGISTIVSRAWESLLVGGSLAWQGIKDVFSELGNFFRDTFKNAWAEVKQIFSTGGKIFDGIKEGIVSSFTNIVNKIISGINRVIANPFNALNDVIYSIKNFSIAGMKPFSGLWYISVPSIPLLQYASGGFPNVGEMFIARENGPELVGTMGGRNVVANNQQIEEGIAKASYSGMKQALMETNANQSGDVYVQNTVKIGDETISKSIKKANKDEVLKTGEPIFEETW